MRFKLQGRTYTATAVFDRVPLIDLLTLEVELETLGRPMKWSQVREMVQRISHLDDPEKDPEYMWFLGLLVWGTRRLAGESVNFAEAVDFGEGVVGATRHRVGHHAGFAALDQVDLACLVIN